MLKITKETCHRDTDHLFVWCRTFLWYPRSLLEQALDAATTAGVAKLLNTDNSVAAAAAAAANLGGEASGRWWLKSNSRFLRGLVESIQILAMTVTGRGGGLVWLVFGWKLSCFNTTRWSSNYVTPVFLMSGRVSINPAGTTAGLWRRGYKICT